MDGEFDSQNFVVSDNGMRIYAAVRGNKLYTATWSTKGGTNDHFIFITDQFGNPLNHPWAKAGRIYGRFDFTAQTKPWIGADPTSAYANGFGVAGRFLLGNQGKAMETEIDLLQVFGSVPKIVYIAVGAYPRANGSNLIGQAPASFGNQANDIEIPEFQALNTASVRDEDLDGRFDVGNPEMIVAVSGNETDGNYGLRRFYLDEVAQEASSLTVKFKPNTVVAPSQVEVFTNLNRRDFAVLEEDPSTVTTTSNTYFRAYAMTGPDVQGFYTATLPINLCGAYRLQVRYKVNGGDYVYYTDHAQRRDCAVSAGAVLDHDRLAECGAHVHGDGTCSQVGAATGGKRHYETNRLVGPVGLRPGGLGQGTSQGERTARHHHAPAHGVDRQNRGVAQGSQAGVCMHTELLQSARSARNRPQA
jgi:hypothetical protein